MKIKDLSGKIHTWNLHGYQVDLNDIRPRSSGHITCRTLLKKLFPLDLILEEPPVPGENLFLDFFLPGRKMIVEVQGAQHEQFVPFFHKTKAKFVQAQNRDKRKANWCEINGFRLVELLDTEDEATWTRKLLNV